MSCPNGPAAGGNTPSGGPDTEAEVQDGPRTGMVTIEVEAGPGTTTIYISGELDLVTMPFLAEHLTLVLRDKPERLVFDMARTGFSSATRVLASVGSSSSPALTRTAR